MVQVLAVEVMVVLIVVDVKANGASASAVFVYMLSVLILLLGKSRLRADVFHIYQGRRPFFLMPMMISACGEILGSADGADGARPPLSSTHYGLQRRCGAEGGKRSAVFGSPAELASPIRLGYMSARPSAKAARPARLKGKRYGRLCQLLSPEGPLSNRHRPPTGLSPQPPGEINARETEYRRDRQCPESGHLT